MDSLFLITSSHKAVWTYFEAGHDGEHVMCTFKINNTMEFRDEQEPNFVKDGL